MSLFWEVLQTDRLLQFAVLTSLLAAVACGVVGTFVSVRRISYIAGAIAHCTLGGMGAARYFEKVVGVTWLSPVIGATIAALIAAVIIGFVTTHARERVDTVLSAVWSVGMAIGLVFISRTPGYNEDLMSYLFGNIVMVSRADLLLLAGLDVVILLTCLLCYNRLLAVCFDEEYAWLRGITVQGYDMLFLCLIAITVVLLTQVVGIVMVIAMLALPAAAASQFTKRLLSMMVAAVVLSASCMVGGLAISYEPDLPAGPTIILSAAVVYILAIVIQRFRRRKAG
jgi:zinc transport system permease protein